MIGLREKLNGVVDGTADLVAGLSVKRFPHGDSNVVVVCPEFYWGDATPKQQAEQFKLKRSYEQIAELLKVLLRQAPDSLQREFETADNRLRIWLELASNWSIKPSVEHNVAALREDASLFNNVIDVLSTGTGVIVVPDTNALLADPDPATHWRGVFTWVLLPVTLGELDRLKIEHKNPDVRDKAKRAITRVKGWRNQGSLSEGVTVNKTITVKAIAQEPRMSDSLPWLDPDVMDDRIIAGVLELQAQNPGARVVLVTGDINLMNKADAALIEVVDHG